MKRKIISIITILAMCLTIGSVPTWAAETGEMTNVTVPNQGNVPIGTVGTQSVSVFVPQTAKPLEPQANTVHEVITTNDAVTWTTGWYIVQGSAVEISQRINVEGNVNLILADGASLSSIKGITVEGTNSLTIWGQEQGSGKLTITSGIVPADYAGIGGGKQKKVGNITINGGVVKSSGNITTACIGGGTNSAVQGNKELRKEAPDIHDTSKIQVKGHAGRFHSDCNGLHADLSFCRRHSADCCDYEHLSHQAYA